MTLMQLVFIIIIIAATSTDLLRATCPTEFLATYNNLLITDYTGATPCDGNNVNGCYNKTALTYTYQSCASSLVFNGKKYIHIYMYI